MGDASRMLGVDPATLRRWSDAGRVNAFTTPGGHRRFRRATLERLLPTERTVRPSLAHSGMTASRLVRAYRAQLRSMTGAVPWVAALDEEQRAWFRSHGRRVSGRLLAYLDAPNEAARRKHLEGATAEAAEYGRVAAGLGVSLSDAVEGFLRFRRPFQEQLALVASRRGLDAGSTSALIDSAERALDRLLVAAMAAHSIAHGSRRRRRRVIDSEGLT